MSNYNAVKINDEITKTVYKISNIVQNSNKSILIFDCANQLSKINSNMSIFTNRVKETNSYIDSQLKIYTDKICIFVTNIYNNNDKPLNLSPFV